MMSTAHEISLPSGCTRARLAAAARVLGCAGARGMLSGSAGTAASKAAVEAPSSELPRRPALLLLHVPLLCGESSQSKTAGRPPLSLPPHPHPAHPVPAPGPSRCSFSCLCGVVAFETMAPDVGKKLSNLLRWFTGCLTNCNVKCCNCNYSPDHSVTKNYYCDGARCSHEGSRNVGNVSNVAVAGSSQGSRNVSVPSDIMSCNK
jgi:hypothetical protein